MREGTLADEDVRPAKGAVPAGTRGGECYIPGGAIRSAGGDYASFSSAWRRAGGYGEADGAGGQDAGHCAGVQASMQE